MKILLSPILFFLSLSIASAEETSLDSLKNWIALPQKERNPIKENEFANSPISKSEANEAKEILWKDHISLIKSQRSNEIKQKRISIGDKTLKYDYLVFGEKPETGRSLYISMHGGGGAPPQVNEGQWKNQQQPHEHQAQVQARCLLHTPAFLCGLDPSSGGGQSRWHSQGMWA